MKKILVTGGCGFIGSNFIKYILKQAEDSLVINLDKLTYAGNPNNLSEVEKEFAPSRYIFIKGDICDKALLRGIFGRYDIDWVVNFAAESHVDRSIKEPAEFLHTNVLGTFELLEAAKHAWLDTGTGASTKRFVHISTDEVYGSLGEHGLFTEETVYDPSSPYSASKAASDHLVNAYYRTYSLPAIITNSSNNYGPYQFPEKLIPLMVTNAIRGKRLPVYGDGGNIRDWIYVEDNCSAILKAIQRGVPGEKYNIGADCQKRNIDIVRMICDYLDERMGKGGGAPRRDLMEFVEDRPGHDRRYAIDASKLRERLFWSPSVTFDEGIRLTISWYLENMAWVEDIETGRYRKLEPER